MSRQRFSLTPQWVLLMQVLFLLSCHHAIYGFKFMEKLKVPSYQDRAKEVAVQQKFGDKRLVVITGTSSGLGRRAALALLRTKKYHVIGAVRDVDKMAAVAEFDGFDMDSFTTMHCEMTSFDSVRKFCTELKEFCMNKPIDRLICNAGVYQPSLPYPKWSQDGHEQTMQINYLSHFLMISELMPNLMTSDDPRVTMVGSVTGNDNTVGGGGVYPIADLHELDGFKAGFRNPIGMADGYSFDGAKAYKDSKLCLMMLSNTLHAKYHKLTGISFSSLYPGCIAESPLFREKRDWFRQYFPIFMKFITGGFVSEEEAGQRLMQVAHDPRCAKSGVYWSWNGGPREGRGAEALEKGGQISGGGGAGGGWDSIYENDQSAKVLNFELAMKLFEYSAEITGAQWPNLSQITSPCPTLKVIGAVSKYMIAKEEFKRMRGQRPGFEADGTVSVKPISKIKKTQLVADRVVTGVFRNTLGRVKRFLGRRVLGRLPTAALEGTYIQDDDETKQMKAKVEELTTTRGMEAEQETVKEEEQDAQQMLEQEIANQVFTTTTVSKEEAAVEVVSPEAPKEGVSQEQVRTTSSPSTSTTTTTAMA